MAEFDFLADDFSTDPWWWQAAPRPDSGPANAPPHKADVVVVGLIGERGREVGDFVRNALGPEGLGHAVVVVATVVMTNVLNDQRLVTVHKVPLPGRMVLATVRVTAGEDP